MKLQTFVCFLFIAYLTPQISSKTVPELKKDVLEQILPKTENEVFVPPGNRTIVETSLHILNIENLDEKDMELTLTLYFRQGWKDQRLRYVTNDKVDSVTINDDDAIWTPDTFFVNQKQGHGFNVLRPNVFIKIYPDGSVLMSKKVLVILSCPMEFTRFPFDTQQCNLRMESYGSGTESILLKWKDRLPISVSNQVTLRLFQLDKLVSSFGTIQMSSVEYSFLNLNFYFTRQLGYYVYQMYLPSILLVALSWLPFWLKKQALIARLLINLGLLLTYTMVMIKFQNKQPRTSSMTSMMYFIWMCVGFLVTSLLETVILHVLSKEDEQIKDCFVEAGEIKRSKSKINFLVLGSRYLVPLLFIMLCVAYFGIAGHYDSNNGLEIPANGTTEIVIN